MAKTIDDISNEIFSLRNALVTGTITLNYKVPDENDDKKTTDKQAIVSQLKHSLIGEAPKILTEEAAAPWIKQVGDIHEEVTKNPVSEYLETMGLDGVAAGVEKIYEGKNFSVVWPYFASAFVGLFVPLVGGMLLASSTLMQRRLQNALLDRMATRFPSLTNRTIAMNDNGTRPGLVDRNHLQQREDAAAGGLASIPTGANFGPLRRQLQLLNPHLEAFNQHAPGFVTNYHKLPSSRAVTKIGVAIKKLKESMVGVNADDVGKVADALDKFPTPLPDARKLAKINKVVKDANPQAMKDVAKGAGKLVGVQQHLDPARWQALPKARTLSSAAKSAERLAKAGRDVGHAFDALKLAASQALTVIGPPATS
ncbi:hypothetical protein [Streptomyces sp. NPDC003943]